MIRLILFLQTLSISYVLADIRCSAEIAPMYFAEFRIDEKLARIYMSATHQFSEAPYAKNSNPSETIWFAQYSKERAITILQRNDTQQLSLCIDKEPCKTCKTFE